MPINKIAYQVLEENQQNYINILRTGQSVSDVGWSTYADPAGTNPVDGTGGTASITWTQNTSSPLSGDSDLRLVKDASNRQGNGVSTPFTIANRHLGKVLQITFDAELITPTNTYENPIPIPVTGIYSISSTTCTVTATHNFIQGQSVFITVTSVSSGAAFPNGFYTITAVTSTTFSFIIVSGSGTGNCNYTTIGDIRISIIQDPTGTPVVLEPVNTNLQLGITNQRIRHIASFQTHISITSYRLCIHVGSASTVAYTVDFANFKVWEPTQSIGAVITEPVSYTPTFVGMSPTSVVFTWQRVGKNIKIKGRGIVASNTSTQWSITTPNGIIPDLGYTSGDGVFVGTMIRGASSDGNLLSLLGRNDNLIRVGSYLALNAGTNPLSWGTSNPFNSSEAFNVDVEFPVLGWGSSVVMSSDSGDGRIVAAIVKNLQTGKTTSNGFYWSTIQNDTHNAIRTTGSGATQRTEFVVPLSGYYRVSCTVNFNNTGAVNIYKNSSVKLIELMYTTTANISQNLSSSVFLNAGDFIYIATSATYTSNSDSDVGFSIERISAGSQVIASSESVTVICRTISNGITSTPSPISWTSKEVDSHGAFTASSSRFTAPMSGIYNFHVTWASSNGNAGLIALYDVTNSIYLRQTLNPQDSASRLSVSLSSSVRLLAGQIIEIRFFQISGTSTLSSNLFENFLSIIRVGNY